MKSAEEERTQKLDSTLADIDSVVAELKDANKRREIEERSIKDQLHGIKDIVPKAIEGWKGVNDARLEELGAEVRSLKMLLQNRIGGGARNAQPYSGRASPGPGSSGDGKDPAGANGLNTPKADSGNSTAQEIRDEEVASASPGERPSTSAPAPGVTEPKKDFTNRYSRAGGASIPAWQMAGAGGSTSS